MKAYFYSFIVVEKPIKKIVEIREVI